MTFFSMWVNYTFSQTSKAAAVCAEFRSKLPAFYKAGQQSENLNTITYISLPLKKTQN